MKAVVIGHPIAHSKSPLIHDYWMRKHNIQGTYERLDIHPDNLQEEIKNLISQGYNGFNVTVPHKEEIFKLCDSLDDSAKIIGAVNTVVIKGEKLIGANTDAYGFIQNIKSSKPNFDFKNKTVFILGAGGASRAVIYGLIQEGVSKIKLSNRTKDRAIMLSEVSPDKIRIVEWQDIKNELSDIDLLVNTTSLGMASKPTLSLDLSMINKSAIVNDIVYTPLMTDLLKDALNQGNEIVTGIGMLLHQARPAFEAWTDISPAVTKELEEIVLK